jgi:hypothetical protein
MIPKLLLTGDFYGIAEVVFRVTDKPAGFGVTKTRRICNVSVLFKQ